VETDIFNIDKGTVREKRQNPQSHTICLDMVLKNINEEQKVQ
jgi:hypothetical protein